MTDLTQQNTEDLKKSIADKRASLRVFRFGGAGSRTRNVREGRGLRKDIARILTEIRKREITTSKKV